MSEPIALLRRIIFPIAISASGLLSMSLIAPLSQRATFPHFVISRHVIVNSTFTMQMIVLVISFIVIGIMYLYDKNSVGRFLRLRIPSTDESHWNVYGPLLALAFTLGTATLMAMSVTLQHGKFNDTFFSLVPMVLLISATNAWSEEIFSRLTIVAGLTGKLPPTAICWISAILFGIPHFLGTPGGLFGVITSGLLGWVLAKSVIESKGLGWALIIHFLQDVIIFGAGAMIIAGQE